MNATELAEFQIASDHELLIQPTPSPNPGYCLASLADEDAHGFILTSNVPPVVDPNVCISVSWVLTTAAKLGMVPVDALADAEARAEDYRQQLEDALKALNAVEAIEQEGFRRIRKPGKAASVEPLT